MYEWKPITPRVAEMRERYRSTTPRVCLARYKLVTEFYMQNAQLTGILKRAKNLRNLFENIPVLVNDGEIIVGEQVTSYRASALYPEITFKWLVEELTNGDPSQREVDKYIISPEDKQYILDTKDFWLHNNMSAVFDEYVPEGYKLHAGNGACMFGVRGNAGNPVGHFCANFEKALHVGFGAIRQQAEDKMAEMEKNGIYGSDNTKYSFYRAVSIVTGGLIIWSKRYSAECARLAALEQDPARKEELLDMAECLGYIMEHPCRNFHDALQCMYLYQLGLCLDGQQHGISLGRVDQDLAPYLEADLRSGALTPEKAQELMDLFYLKLAEPNKMIAYYPATLANPGYTSGMLMTLGGVGRDGRDATNEVTYMMLESASRLLLHSPPQALRISKQTPAKLWEMAIEATKRAGGVPSYENDEVIIPALMKRGLSLESARNYCLIGCVEPQGCGDEWAQPGGTGCESFFNLLSCFLLAINDGTNPMPRPDGTRAEHVGVRTGYLYDMKSFDELLEALREQMLYFIRWHVSIENMWESVASVNMPLPLLSATVDGCMESGKDVLSGGAKYNSTGNAAIGLGNVVDCLNIVKYMCFDKKLCTTRQLYDAVMANWEGYEELHQIIQNEAPHFGNNDPEADRYLNWVAKVYGDAINSATGPRGRWSAGMYPVTTNVIFGWFTWASPDGRKKGEPLSDGISPVQSMDKSGPISCLNSVLHFDQTEFGNGTLLNMKFHPTALKGADGLEKLKALMKTYFDEGGMEMQLNIVSADTLRAAQAHPEEYKDLVVRVAGFSAYFVEVFKDSQDDLIRRTEMAL